MSHSYPTNTESDLLVLADEHRLAVIEHARDCYPNEAVGLLAGPTSSEVTAVYPLKNIGPWRSFLADPFSQWTAFESMKRANSRLVAVYHSHPEGGTSPSSADLHFARDLGALFLIVSINGRYEGNVEIRAYRLNQGHAEEIAILAHEGPRQRGKSQGPEVKP